MPLVMSKFACRRRGHVKFLDTTVIPLMTPEETDMSAGRESRSRRRLAQGNSTRLPGTRVRRGRPSLLHCWMGFLGTSIAVLLTITGIRVAVPLLASTATATTTISQVGTATTFESSRVGTAVTKVPAGTAAGDILLTFVETSQRSSVTCASGAKLILDRSHGAGTRLAGCLTVMGRSIPSAVRVRISPRNQVAAVTMAFAGVDKGTPVDVLATSSSGTSPSVTLSSNDLVVFGLGSSGRAATATPPQGAQLQATVNDSATAQVAAATLFGQQRTVKRGYWSLTPALLPAAATVALLPAPAAGPTPTSSPADGPGVTSPATSLPEVPRRPAPRRPALSLPPPLRVPRPRRRRSRRPQGLRPRLRRRHRR